IDQPDMIFCACFSSGTAPDFSVLYHDLQSYPELRNVTLMGGDGLYTPQGNDAQNHVVYQNMYFTAFTFPDTIRTYCDASAHCSPEQENFYATYCKTFDPSDYNKGPANYFSNCQS